MTERDEREERSLRRTEEVRVFGYGIVDCPVCGRRTFDSHWICAACGWEYDGVARGERSSCNGATVEEYRKAYEDALRTKQRRKQ